MDTILGAWYNSSSIASHRFVCGNCSSDITSNTGYFCQYGRTTTAYIYICHACNRPTLVYGYDQVPAPMLGAPVEHLPKDINDLYAEIRDATAARAYTSAVLSARKLLMHVAVESGAKSGQTFQSYVDYLENNHFTPPNSKSWVDKIRQLGNEANHEIVIMGQTEAKDILKFIEGILRFKYEFPGDVAEEDSQDK